MQLPWLCAPWIGSSRFPWPVTQETGTAFHLLERMPAMAAVPVAPAQDAAEKTIEISAGELSRLSKWTAPCCSWRPAASPQAEAGNGGPIEPKPFKEADFLQRKWDIEEASWVAYSLPRHVEAVQSRRQPGGRAPAAAAAAPAMHTEKTHLTFHISENLTCSAIMLQCNCHQDEMHVAQHAWQEEYGLHQV